MTALTEISPNAFFEKVGDKDMRIWTVTPKCPTGPCDADATSVIPPATKPSAPFVVHFTNGDYVDIDSFALGNCGTAISGNAFNGTYTVTARPTKFMSSGSAVYVAELDGTRTLVATPTAAAASAGCTRWTVTWDVGIVRRA